MNKSLALLQILLPLMLSCSGEVEPPLPERHHNCRLSAMLIGKGFPMELMPIFMDNLQARGPFNPHGWGLVWFPVNGKNLLPVTRRGGRAAQDDIRFDFAAWEAALNSCRAVVAHIRFSTTVLSGIPNPHPFVREGIALAHNGTVSRSAFYPLVKPFFKKRPPDYRDRFASSLPEYQLIDSEMLLIYLLAMRDKNKGDTEAAIIETAKTVKRVSRYSTLNLVISDGQTLWALSRGYSGNLLRYFFEPVTKTTAVASERVALPTWPQIPDWTLMTAERNKAPTFKKI